MSPSPDTLQTILYHGGSGVQRLDECLCAHACLFGRESVPRIFIPRNTNPHTPQEWTAMTQTCLASSDAETRAHTSRTLHALGLGHEWVPRDASSRASLLDTVMVMIEDSWGEGEIHYEMLRFTPFSAEDINLFLPVMPWGETSEAVKSALGLRAAEQSDYFERYGPMCGAGDIRADTPAFDRVLTAKVREQWQERWLDARRYFPREQSDDMIDSLDVSTHGGL
jgi:hypothetical protein